MSFTALNAALSGLRVAQQQLSTISNNVANATTPGYTRKILPQSSQVIENTGQTIGVLSGTLTRNVDLNLEKELWTQVSSVSASDVKATYLANIEKFHGTTDQEHSISAEIAALKDKFSALTDSPSDGFSLQATVDQAKVVAGKFNDYGKLVQQMRNDAQDEMSDTINRVNDLLNTIAGLNDDIKGSANLNRPTATLEDKRDDAIKELAGYMNITSFTRGDGVLVVQSSNGAQLADEKASSLYFNPSTIGATATYPTGAAAVYVGGDPLKNPGAYDITDTDIGGKLGGLIELRDKILPQYQAQVDELAHQLASRMDAQGLKLFTDPTGAVPADTPPDPTTVPPTSVTYVGFANTIQVNKDIVNNVQLIQQGTYTSDTIIPQGSNEVIRRVIQFGFGNVNYQQAAGTTNLNVALPAADLQDWLGLHSTNNVVGGIDLSSFPQISDGTAGTPDLAEDLQSYFPNYPADDQFNITFNDPRLGVPAETINIDLSDAQAAFPIGGSIHNALDQIIAQINAQIGTMTPAGQAAFAPVASRNSNGQLVVTSRANIKYDASSFAGSMGTSAFNALGLQEKDYATEDPYFDVQVGEGDPVRITIEPGDTAADLANKLTYNPATHTGVPGLDVDYNAGTGQLTLRPGMDNTNGGPSFGGDIRIVSGPGKTTGAVNPVLAALPAGVSVVGAIFGSYNVSGTTVTEASPVQNVFYGSETKAGSGVYVPFRDSYLGPDASTKTNILTGVNLVDFATKLVNSQAQDINMNTSQQADATSLRDLLQQQYSNQSGVNIDEELSNLIVIQTAYAASARAVTAASDMFDELLNAIR